jgi:hypothetical protein
MTMTTMKALVFGAALTALASSAQAQYTTMPSTNGWTTPTYNSGVYNTMPFANGWRTTTPNGGVYDTMPFANGWQTTPQTVQPPPMLPPVAPNPLR